MSRSRLTRRAVLSWGLGGVGALAVAGLPGTFAAAAAAVTLWQLDPDWGTPRTSPSGKVRTRCRGAACHSAAPHRFFLTEADARAGRLHPGCLAEPVAVAVTLSLDDLAPYYRARLGGVDARCPDLPADLLTALTSFTPGPAPTTTTTTSTTTSTTSPSTTSSSTTSTSTTSTTVPPTTTTVPPTTSTTTTEPADPGIDGVHHRIAGPDDPTSDDPAAAMPGSGPESGSGSATVPGARQPAGRPGRIRSGVLAADELAFSGGDAATTAAAALAAMALGAVALGAASVRSERDDPPRS